MQLKRLISETSTYLRAIKFEILAQKLIKWCKDLQSNN